jgi:hypothetical protein
VSVDVISVSAVLYIINCYQNGPKKVSGRLGTFYNILVSTLGKLLVFLVNYTHYTTLFYYEKVSYGVIWEVWNALWVFLLFLMGKIVLTCDQLELRPSLANELRS